MACDDVGFADRRADDAAAVAGGDVVEHPAAGEIGDRDAAGLARQHPLGGQGERIFFADVGAVFIDDGQAVGIGVLGEADGGLLPADFVAQAGEVFRGRLGLVGELAVGRGVDVDELAAELVEQRGGGDAAGPVDAVEHDFESLGGDAEHVDVVEHALDMQGVGFAVLLRRDELLARGRSRCRCSSIESLDVGRIAPAAGRRRRG